MTISWATEIINAIRYYSQLNFYVLQFGKILKGHISENQRNISKNLQDHISFLIKQSIEEKYFPLNKSEVYTNKISKSIFDGK